MKRFTKIRTLMLTLCMLLGTIPASPAERPFALKGAGVATLITDESGNLVGAVATGSGTATHLSFRSSAMSLELSALLMMNSLPSFYELSLSACDRFQSDKSTQGT